jgi:hypothetical protein
MIDYFVEPYNSKRKNNWNKGRTIGAIGIWRRFLLLQTNICSLVDKVNSRVQRGSCCTTSVSKAFHKKPAEALLAGEANYAFKKINQNQVLPHFVAEILETYTLTYIYPLGKKSLLLLEDR